MTSVSEHYHNVNIPEDFVALFFNVIKEPDFVFLIFKILPMDQIFICVNNLLQFEAFLSVVMTHKACLYQAEFVQFL